MERSLVAAAVTAAALLVAVTAYVPAVAQQNEVTIDFELTVEGAPPADATFFGQNLAQGTAVRLTDPDGDGVYTGSMSSGTPDEGFRIVQGRGTEETTSGVSPGGPVAVIETFPAPNVEGGAATLSSIIYFDEREDGGTVSATGVLEKPDTTTYMYGTHAIADEATGVRYALESDDVDLDAYVGERVTISGDPVPGYENGQVEGGPTLLEVRSAEPATAARGATVAFKVKIEDEVPKNVSFYVESDAFPGGVICTTDRAVNEQAGYPECKGNGETERLEVPMAPGQEFDYRLLTNRGNELSQSVVAEGYEVAEDGLVVEASYSFAETSNGEDVNEDGVVDEADVELAKQVSDDAKSGIDPEKNPLPISGGAALLVLLAGSGLAAAGYAAHRATR